MVNPPQEAVPREVAMGGCLFGPVLADLPGGNFRVAGARVSFSDHPLAHGPCFGARKKIGLISVTFSKKQQDKGLKKLEGTLFCV